MAVLMAPGWIELTRIPRSASSRAAALGNAADPELARAVSGQARRADEALDRGDVHDRATAGRRHRLDHSLHTEPRAREVDVDHPAEVAKPHVGDLAVDQDAGVVDEHVQFPERPHRCRHGCRPVVFAGDIHAQEPAVRTDIAGDIGALGEDVAEHPGRPPLTKCLTCAAPMPRAPPVISATLPSSLPMSAPVPRSAHAINLALARPDEPRGARPCALP